VRPDQVDLYDSGRNLAGKPFTAACYAPFGSMYFDVHGNVIACCQNTRHVLGNVADQSIDEIWHGEKATELRDALKAYDLSRGCEFCQWQVDDGNLSNLFATVFDDVRVDGGPDVWPSQLEFALSNTCNLECVMCNGDFSSKIRARREGLPPLPAMYDEQFFEEIRPFLRHADRARFFGGEPFLARESFRLWDLMIEDGLRLECNVTTNGTQWNYRVERVLEALPFTIGISMDGLTRETIESIRVGASYDELLRNFKRFHAHAELTRRTLSLTYCLMRSNWHEFGAFLQFADDQGCPVYVNTVVYPPHLSLYRLARSDLSVILLSLESQGRTLESRLGRNRHVWITEIDRLKNWVGRLSARQALHEGHERLYFEFPGPNPLPPAFSERASGSQARPFGRAEAESLLADEQWLGEVSLLILDDHELVLDSGDGSGFLGLPQDLCSGRSFVDVLASLHEQFGSLPRMLSETIEADYVDRRVVFDATEGDSSEVRMVVWPTFDEVGNINGSRTVAVLVATHENHASEQPVTLRSSADDI